MTPAIKKNLLFRPAPVLRRAVAAWKAGIYNPATDALVDLTGHGLHMRLGSAVGADTNDPLQLRFSGEKYLYVPNVSGNNVTASGTAAGAETMIVEGRVLALPSTNSGFFHIGPQGDVVHLSIFPDGTISWKGHVTDRNTANRRSIQSSAGVVVPGRWFRTKVVANASVFTMDVSHSTDGTTWTWIEQVTGTPFVQITDADACIVGAGNQSYVPFDGKITHARLRSADETLLKNFVVSDAVEPYATVTASTGEIWTFNRGTSGRKLCVVDRDLLLLGTDDYLEVADHALLNFSETESFTIALLMRQYGTHSSTRSYTAKKVGAVSTDTGWTMFTDNSAGPYTPRFNIADGTNQVTTNFPAIASGITQLRSGVRNVSTDKVIPFIGQTPATAGTDPTTGTLATAVAMTVANIGGVYADFEFMGMAVFRAALTADELRRLAIELGVTP